MQYLGYLSVIINALLGGGIIIQFITMRSIRAKAQAQAGLAKAETESKELDNVNEAITIWREMAKSLKEELQESRSNYDSVAKEVNELRSEINKLTATSNKIVKLLDRITHDNLDKMVEQIKNEINGKAI
jgi:predicted  nucleic acid-binding Zn-ribbon protein